MLIDWNGNGQIDPDDIAISLAMDEAGVFDEEEYEGGDDLEEYQDERRRTVPCDWKEAAGAALLDGGWSVSGTDQSEDPGIVLYFGNIKGSSYRH